MASQKSNQQNQTISSYNFNRHDAACESMKEAYDLGADLALEQLSMEDKAALKNMKQDTIIVVPGTYDHIHQVLNHLKVPFTTVSQAELLTYPLRPADQSVYVNCADNFPVEAAHRLRQFVEEGGQLMTTDWALKNVLEIAFREFIVHNGKTTGDEVVGIQVNDPTNPLVSDFLLASKNAEPLWWLESSSYPIKIVDSRRVRTLIKSDEMKARHGSEAILVTFDCGKGNVIHMVSHFYLQRSETRNERHKFSSEQYAAEMGASEEVLTKARQMKNINYGQVQSAQTAAGFLYKQIAERSKRNLNE